MGMNMMENGRMVLKKEQAKWCIKVEGCKRVSLRKVRLVVLEHKNGQMDQNMRGNSKMVK